jgi:hypothetical protein
MRDRRHVVLAVGLTATFAALPAAGWRTAQADELKDLRANQVLLEQRLDRLANGTPAPGGVYPSGTPAKTAGAAAATGSFPRSFLIPGTTTSVRVGGTIEFDAGHAFNGGTGR